jgi:hypothetical protein
MTKLKYAEHRRGFGLYAVVEIESIETQRAESFVSDTCTWNMIKSENPTYEIGPGYHDWKDSATYGIRCALSKITHHPKVEIKLLDLNCHPAHSNHYSMFAAGFLCLFKDFGVKLSGIDHERVVDFVARSAGSKNFDEKPDGTALVIGQYAK